MMVKGCEQVVGAGQASDARSSQACKRCCSNYASPQQTDRTAACEKQMPGSLTGALCPACWNSIWGGIALRWRLAACSASPPLASRSHTHSRRSSPALANTPGRCGHHSTTVTAWEW